MALELGDERQRRLRLQALALAVVGMTLLVAVAWLWKAPSIEDDIEDRARARLRFNEYPVDDELVVIANGRNVAVYGPIDDVADVVRVQQLLVPLYGVRRVDTDGLAVRPPPQADIVLLGVVRDETITLSGELSTIEQRDALVGTLEADFTEVDAEQVSLTEVDPLRGDDDNRLAAFGVLAAALAGPDTVEAVILVEDGALGVTAVVRSDEQADRVADPAEQFDAALALGIVGVDVDQVELEIIVEPDLVLVSGQVLTNDQRLDVLQAAERAVGPGGVEADIVLVDRPPAFDDADERIAVALGVLDRLVMADITEALVTVADGRLTVTVAANTIAEATTLRDELADESMELIVVVAADPVLFGEAQAAALTIALTDVEQRLQQSDNFAPGSDQLLPSARAGLREAVPALAANPDPVVRVVVHTDRRGSASANADLSQRRAENVVAYLIDQGVDSGRLVAVGAGETRPLVEPESDDADYALNRRIEFEVIAP